MPEKTIKMILTSPIFFRISVLCKLSSLSECVGENGLNNNSVKIGKEETNFMVTGN